MGQGEEREVEGRVEHAEGRAGEGAKWGMGGEWQGVEERRVEGSGIQRKVGCR